MARLWLPTDAKSAILEAWYTTQDSSTYTVNAGKVSRWASKAGAVVNAGNQADASLQATYVASAPNGKPAFSFDGIDDRMPITPVSAFTTDYSGSTVCIAAISGSRSTNGSNRQAIFATGPSIGNAMRAYQSNNDKQEFEVYNGNQVGDVWPTNTRAVLLFSMDPQAGEGATTARSRFNLAAEKSSPIYYYASTNTSADIGYWRNLNGGFLEGLLQEIVAYNGKLSAEEEEILAAYVHWNNGNEDLIPAGNQYKNSPPMVDTVAERLWTPADAPATHGVTLLAWWDGSVAASMTATQWNTVAGLVANATRESVSSPVRADDNFLTFTNSRFTFDPSAFPAGDAKSLCMVVYSDTLPNNGARFPTGYGRPTDSGFRYIGNAGGQMGGYRNGNGQIRIAGTDSIDRKIVTDFASRGTGVSRVRVDGGVFEATITQACNTVPTGADPGIIGQFLGNDFYQGDLSQIVWVSGEVSDAVYNDLAAHLEGWAANKLQMQDRFPAQHNYKSTPPMVAGTAPVAKSLSASGGAFSESGGTANLLHGYVLPAGPTAVALTGLPAGTVAARRLTCAVAPFTLQGRSANVVQARRLIAAPAALTLTGKPANTLALRRLTAAPAAITLQGGNTSAVQARRLLASPAAVAFTGRSANTILFRRLVAAPGAIVTQGGAAVLAKTRHLLASAGSAILTGYAASLLRGFVISAQGGSVASTGQPANVRASRRLTSQAGSFVMAGMAAVLSKVSLRQFPADPVAFQLTGSTAALRRLLRIRMDPGAVILSGSELKAGSSRSLPAERGSMIVTGVSIGLLRGFALFAGGAAIAAAGGPSVALIRRRLIAGAGAVALTGAALTFSRTRRLLAGPMAFALSGRAVTLKVRAAVQLFPIASRVARAPYRDPIVYALENGPMLRWPSKRTSEVVDYGVDWSKRLSADETIAESEGSSASGIQIVAKSVEDNVQKVRLAGGKVGRGTVVCQITTSAGQVLEEEVGIVIGA